MLGESVSANCWGLSGSPGANSTPTGQPHRKPTGQMYSASNVVHTEIYLERYYKESLMLHSKLSIRLITETSHTVINRTELSQ